MAASIPVLDLTKITGTGSGVPVTGDPVAALTAQVNRFLKASGRPLLAVTPGVVTLDLANSALILRQGQLSAAVVQYPTDVSIQAQLAEVAAAQAAPIPYVQAHLVQLTQQLQFYADSQFGVPWTPLRWAITVTAGLATVVTGLLLVRRHRALRNDSGV